MAATSILELQKAGFTREQVEAIARYVDDRLDFSHLTTKADLTVTKTELEKRIADVKADLEVKLAETKADLIKWVVGVGFAQVATIVAVLKLFPGGAP